MQGLLYQVTNLDALLLLTELPRHERGPSGDLALQLEAIDQMPDDDKRGAGKLGYQVSLQAMGFGETGSNEEGEIKPGNGEFIHSDYDGCPVNCRLFPAPAELPVFIINRATVLIAAYLRTVLRDVA